MSCQGNGHEADFDGDEQVYIIDVYNAFIYPGDTKVKSRSTYCSFKFILHDCFPGQSNCQQDLVNIFKNVQYTSVFAPCLM